MTQVLSLLIMAVQLLTAAQNSPNLTPEFRQTAINLANYSISVAQEAIQNQTPEVVVPQNIPVIPQQPVQPVYVQPPVVLGTPTPIIPEPPVEKKIKTHQSNGDIAVAYTENGVLKSGVPITITTIPNDTEIFAKIDDYGNTSSTFGEATRISGLDGGSMLGLRYNARFTLSPRETGYTKQTVTVTANGVSETRDFYVFNR